MIFVPVVDKNNHPLMPTTPSRARRWVKEKKATYFWKGGIFCVRLNTDPSNRVMQEVAVGIDPGSKREGYTIKSEDHTYLNLQANAVDWVKDAMDVRRSMRRNRRGRKTPYRKCRRNKSKTFSLAPSTKARWDWKLRICKWLKQIFPISHFIVEDIQAVAKKGYKKWNTTFSPLQIGKVWFYKELSKMGNLVTKYGYETKELRDLSGLKKHTHKLSDRFDAHCVDAWVLANCIVGGHLIPDNDTMFKIIPLRFHRRQLHAFQYASKGVRRKYGGTMTGKIKRGSLVKHLKWGMSYIGGESKTGITLHSLETGGRICRNAKLADISTITILRWRILSVPV